MGSESYTIPHNNHCEYTNMNCMLVDGMLAAELQLTCKSMSNLVHYYV